MNEVLRVFVIAVALAMDAVSVSIAVGIREQKHSQREALKLALFFGGFQALMPVIGWLVGSAVRDVVSHVASPIACVLLAAIGIKMIFDSRSQTNEQSSLPNKKLFGLAIATSIDALVVGASLRLTDIPLGVSVTIIGLVTALLCYCAYIFSRYLGKLFGQRVELVGGVVLILIGFSFLLR